MANRVINKNVSSLGPSKPKLTNWKTLLPNTLLPNPSLAQTSP